MDKNPTTPRNHTQAGFTLIEIMVVIVILGLLVTVVGPGVFRALTESEESTCRANMRSIEDAVKQYMLFNRRQRELPTIEDLITPDEKGNAFLDTEEEPIDPWGTEFQIREGEGRGKFMIVSAGPDGDFDTDDDLTTADKREDDE